MLWKNVVTSVKLQLIKKVSNAHEFCRFLRYRSESYFLEENTSVKLIIGSNAQCMLCFEICTPEGREGEKRPISKQSTQSLLPKKYLDHCIHGVIG